MGHKKIHKAIVSLQEEYGNNINIKKLNLNQNFKWDRAKWFDQNKILIYDVMNFRH